MARTDVNVHMVTQELIVKRVRRLFFAPERMFRMHLDSFSDGVGSRGTAPTIAQRSSRGERRRRSI